MPVVGFPWTPGAKGVVPPSPAGSAFSDHPAALGAAKPLPTLDPCRSSTKLCFLRSVVIRGRPRQWLLIDRCLRFGATTQALVLGGLHRGGFAGKLEFRAWREVLHVVGLPIGAGQRLA